MSKEKQVETFLTILREVWENNKDKDGFAFLGDCVLKTCRRMDIEPYEGREYLESTSRRFELIEESPYPRKTGNKTVKWNGPNVKRSFLFNGVPLGGIWYKGFTFKE